MHLDLEEKGYKLIKPPNTNIYKRGNDIKVKIHNKLSNVHRIYSQYSTSFMVKIWMQAVALHLGSSHKASERELFHLHNMQNMIGLVEP